MSNRPMRERVREALPALVYKHAQVRNNDEFWALVTDDLLDLFTAPPTQYMANAACAHVTASMLSTPTEIWEAMTRAMVEEWK